MDWNNDGRKDVISGESYDGGNIRIYLNSGTDASPVFSGYSNLMVGASAFACGYYVTSNYYGSQSCPFIADWNNDGKKDVIVGYILAKFYYLQNTGSDAAPAFSSMPYLQTTLGVDLTTLPGWRSNPVVIDWDGDGKKDLLAGDDRGMVQFYQNVGTAAAPAFSGANGAAVTAGGTNINVGGYARLAVGDWDGDGVADLIVGAQDGRIWFFKRRALDNDGDSMPDYWEVANFPGGTSTSPDADWDGDGLSNEHEFRAGTSPTNAQSVLKLNNVESGSQSNEVRITWQCVRGRQYDIDTCTNLVTQDWQTLTPSPLTGGASSTLSYTNTGLPGAARLMYRIRLFAP